MKNVFKKHPHLLFFYSPDILLLGLKKVYYFVIAVLFGEIDMRFDCLCF